MPDRFPALLAGAALILAAGPVRAEPLDEALALVLAANPEIRAQEAATRAVREAPDWSADLSLSLTEGRTEYGTTAGNRATLSVAVPLVGEGDADRARANRKLTTERARIRREFLADVTALREADMAVETAEERRSYWRDRVAYYREAVEEGVEDADTLWQPADRLQQAEHAYRAALLDLETALDETARRYGGDEWKRLRSLLVEIAN